MEINVPMATNLSRSYLCLNHMCLTLTQKTAQGRIMHFDVVLDEKDSAKGLGHAKTWLESIGVHDAVVTQENCVFCHSAETPPD